MEHTFDITANCVDPLSQEIAPARVRVIDGRIDSIQRVEHAEGFLLPGFVDSHVHIESSMLLPSEFARVAVTHGTVATVSDPHEIANVCGVEGIELMLRDASTTPFKFYFGAPSCVPATPFESAGASIGPDEVATLLDMQGINHLSEVMNFPGVISGNPDVVAKLNEARARRLPIDGHAPGVRGAELSRYLQAGITTDHECVTLEEAIEKIKGGCTIAIREGSAARNFDALWSLIQTHPEACMLCSDDKHPDDLLAGHINQLVVRAIENGADLMRVLQAATVNPVRHYELDVGLLQSGDPADFILVDDLKAFRVRKTWIGGQPVSQDGTSLLKSGSPVSLNRFSAEPLSVDDMVVAAGEQPAQVRAIRVLDGQLITEAVTADALVKKGNVCTDVERDLLKLVVVNRYRATKPAIGFVQGFQMKEGALASSVAHDSHNIVAVGVHDGDIIAAVNAVIECRGGLAACFGSKTNTLPLPVAGLMSNESCEYVANRYQQLDQLAKRCGCVLTAPFMTLSFLALPVIPALKLTDRGLFDVHRFEFVPLLVRS